MELLHLKYFRKIAEYEHVTRAAEKLHIAQSALSRVLKGLESELGVNLFERMGKNIVMNENGRILLRYTNQILTLIEDMQKEINDVNQIRTEETITILVRVASKFLPDILSDFQKKWPNIRFVIIQNDVHSMQQSKWWDICLDASMDFVESEGKTCLLKEKICLAMPKQHPLATRESVCLEEVAGESFIGMQHGSSMNEIANVYCSRAGFQPNIILESDNPATLRGFMRVGLGIAFNPVITWKEVSDDEICLVPITDPECFRYIYVSLRKNVYHSQAVLALKDYLAVFFDNLT